MTRDEYRRGQQDRGAAIMDAAVHYQRRHPARARADYMRAARIFTAAGFPVAARQARDAADRCAVSAGRRAS